MTTFGEIPNSAIIQVPTGDANGAKRRIPCTFESMDGKRLSLEAEERVSMSAVVSVEYNDTLFLGEVISCRRESGDGWRLDIKVEQMLTGLQSLIALRAGLLGEGVAETVGFVPVIASSNGLN